MWTCTREGFPLWALLGFLVLFVAGSQAGVWLLGKVISEEGVESLQETSLSQIVVSTKAAVERELVAPFDYLTRINGLAESPYDPVSVQNASHFFPRLTWHLQHLCTTRQSEAVSGFYVGTSDSYFSGATCSNEPTTPNVMSYRMSSKGRLYFTSDAAISPGSIVYKTQTKAALEYDPVIRPWYVAALTSGAGHLSYTDVYTCFTSEQGCISGVIPIVDPANRNKIVGAAEFDYLLTALNDILDSVGLSSGGSFIVGQDGKTVLARSSLAGEEDVNGMMAHLLAHLDLGYISESFSGMHGSYFVELVPITPRYRGIPLKVIVNDISVNINWNLVIFIHRSYFYGTIDHWNQVSLLVFMSSLVFALLVVTALVTVGLILPIRQLIAGMDEVAKINLKSQEVEKVTSNPDTMVTEICRLNKCFSTMVGLLEEWETYLPEAVAGRFPGSNPLGTPGRDFRREDDASVSILRKLRDWGSLKRRFGTVLVVELVDLFATCDDSADFTIQTIVSLVLEKARVAGGVALSMSASRFIATWNTQIPHVLHAEAACRCAIISHTEIQNGSNWVSFSIASSQLWVGNLGDESHRAPVVDGDAMVQAITLVPLSSMIQVPILATDRVHELVHGFIPCKPVDSIGIPGKTLQTINIFQICLEPLPPEQKATYVTAFHYFRSMQLEKARDTWIRFFNEGGDDPQAIRLLRLTCYLMSKEKGGKREFKDRYYRLSPTWVNLEGKASKSRLPGVVRKVISKLKDAGNYEFNDALEASTNFADQQPAPADDCRSMGSSKSGGLTTPRTSFLGGGQAGGASITSLLDTLSTAGSKHYFSSSFVSDARESTKVPQTFTDANRRRFHRSNRLLGRGAYGEVWLCMVGDGMLVALKSIKIPHPETDTTERSKSTPGVQNLNEIVNEVDLLSRMRHDNIVSYVSNSVCDGYLLIVMEYVSGGNLGTILQAFRQKNTGLPENSVRRYTSDVLCGLEFLHGASIIHRDVKPENILLSTDGICKLADFGAAAIVGSLSLEADTQKPTGTPMYMAPEACRHDACIASDIWSIGVTVCQLLTGELPWRFSDPVDLNQDRILYLMSLEENPMVPHIPPSCPALSLITRCLKRKSEDRPTASELLSDPFLVQV
eukprot:TRINITY_DN15661_c0_g2_i1.p1 TRINITY_DN15661_c0_g2~~TRINITY_DN15661_c0_g2_i1.p1  ORF type:complete len:1125 (+),score=171.97 TRINITY_DN15661_c0_g2_i1:66-3440(+)